MFKLGVCRMEDYTGDSPRGITRKLYEILSRNRVALPLIRPDIPAKPEQISLFEHVIAQVALSSGVYRTTYRGRFRDFNLFVNSHITEHFPADTALRVQDWAASDCLTSTEWAASLFPLYPAATLTASDLTMFLIEARLPHGETLIMETGGELLQYIRPPFVIRLNPPEPWPLVVSRVLARHGLQKAERLRANWKLPASWLQLTGPPEHREGDVVYARIPLVHPEAMDLQNASSRFAIRKHSVFERAPEQADVIRTMNILNIAYFPTRQLLKGVRAVFESLRAGGLWIVGRTYQETPCVHNATIFERQIDGFRALDRFGTGSEIEALVLEVYGRSE
jgi:hypothetical protein